MNTPKFKEGDWIKRKKDGRTAQVVMLLKTCYSLRLTDDDGWWLDYDFQDNWEIISNPNEESGSSETPNDLEEAAEEYFKNPENLWVVKDVFIAGAKWQKVQLMKGVVEGKVFMSFAPGHNQMVMADVDLPTNTKVRIIIVKED